MVAANDLQRNFTAMRPNHKWAGDITYIATREGWLYLAVLLDLYSRRVVGWAMGPQITTALIRQALEMALHQRPVGPGLLHHSDRGSQYAAATYQHRLAALGIHCSMSRPGNCWDNAVVENFFATLKTELIHHQRFQTRQEAKTEIFEYLEGFYNRQRRHSTLGYLSPVEFEERTRLVTHGVY
jgi:transposase InsO family protein